MNRLFLEHPEGRLLCHCNRGRCARHRGFSLTELLVVLGIIALLTTLLLAAVSQMRMASQSAQCAQNLHAIFIGFNQFAAENDHYPDPEASDASWESLLEPYLSQPAVFSCPADGEIFPSVGSSYDWRDTSDPLTTLAGKRLSDVNRANAVLALETLPGWHGAGLINAVRVNGSTQVMNADECLGDLKIPLRNATDMQFLRR